MNKELLYEIAKIVDNDFIGSFETFSCNLIKSEYYYLSTNKCDWSSLIRVYVENNKIIRITRICDDTDSYKDIQSATMEKIIKLVAPKQILKSFALEGKITQVHAQEIETTLTEALRERDEMLEELDRLKRPCSACGGEGFIMEYDDDRYLVQNDCSRCKNTGIEPKLLNKKE